MTRAIIMSRWGAVHRILVGRDGADVTACGQPLLQGRNAPVRSLQALVYHLQPCEVPGCWGTGSWRRFLDGTS